MPTQNSGKNSGGTHGRMLRGLPEGFPETPFLQNQFQTMHADGPTRRELLRRSRRRRSLATFAPRDAFVNSGWEFGGQSTTAATTGTKGGAMSGAVSVSDGVWMYQMTDKGLAADISATGTKYYKDDDLN